MEREDTTWLVGPHARAILPTTRGGRSAFLGLTATVRLRSTRECQPRETLERTKRARADDARDAHLTKRRAAAPPEHERARLLRRELARGRARGGGAARAAALGLARARGLLGGHAPLLPLGAPLDQLGARAAQRLVDEVDLRHLVRERRRMVAVAAIRLKLDLRARAAGGRTLFYTDCPLRAWRRPPSGPETQKAARGTRLPTASV